MKKDIRIDRQKLYLENSCKVCLADLNKKNVIWVRNKTDDIRTCKDIYCSQKCLVQEYKQQIGKIYTNAISVHKNLITQSDIDNEAQRLIEKINIDKELNNGAENKS